MAPARQIPPEVLSQIFRHCLHLEDECAVSKPVERMCRTLVTLSHVCYYWREVAVNDPRLWNNLELDSTYVKDGYKDSSDWRCRKKILLDCSTLCFERAKSRAGSPLSLRCESKVFDSSFLIELVFPHSEHFRHLNLRVPFPRSSFSLAGPGALTFDQLESLILVDLDSSSGPTHPVEAFQIAPNLRKLSIAMENYYPSDFILPLGQLTHIILVDCISTVTWSVILKQCINIQLGSFNLFEDWSTVDLGLSLPSLVDLTIILEIRDFTPQVQPSIWDAMSLPALRTLRLRFLSKVNVVSHVERWAAPSGKYGELLSRIERLSVASCAPVWSPDMLLRLLRASPGLVDLDLQAYNIVELMGRLVAFPHEKLFPCLRRLTIEFSELQRLYIPCVDQGTLSGFAEMCRALINGKEAISPLLESIIVGMEDTFDTKFDAQKMIFFATLHANGGLKKPSGVICKVEKSANCWSRLEVDSGTTPWAEGLEIAATLPHEKIKNSRKQGIMIVW